MNYHTKVFEVEISNGGPRGYETATTLKLPATWAEFHDALEKARIPDGRNCGIELTKSWREGISSGLIGNARNLYELNLFALRLTMLTLEESLSMNGLLKIEGSQGARSIPLPRLINLTFHANCHVAPDVFDDENLGAFLYEGEMLSDAAMNLLDTTEPGSEYRKRLLEVFGEQHRQETGGVFTDCGYVEPDGEAFEEVYKPGEMVYFERSGAPVVLEVSKGFFNDPAYDNDKTALLDLPAIRNAVDKAIDAVDAASEKECGFRCVECRVPSLRELIDEAVDEEGSIGPAEEIASLLKQKERIWGAEEFVKYKALLEASGCPDLKSAAQLMEEIDRYELRPEVAQTWGYAEMALREKYPDLPDELFQTGQAAEIGRKMLEEGNAALTEYGLLRSRDGSPLPCFEQEKHELAGPQLG